MTTGLQWSVVVDVGLFADFVTEKGEGGKNQLERVVREEIDGRRGGRRCDHPCGL